MAQWEIFAAVLALVAGLWGQIKSLFGWLHGFLVCTRWADYEVSACVTAYLHAHARRSGTDPAFEIESAFVRPLRRTQRVAYENLRISGGLYWLNHRPIWIAHHKDGLAQQDHLKTTFSFVRGTHDFEKIIIDALEWVGNAKTYRQFRHRIHYHHGKSLTAEAFNEKKRQQEQSKKYHTAWVASQARRVLGWRLEDIGSIARSSLKELSLTPDLVAVSDEISRWRKFKKWYADRELPWRRGYLFHGLPGTGKTSMVRAKAEELNLPVHIFDLASMSNEDLREAWGEMQEDAPCVALIEDIDGVFKGRVSVAKMGGLMNSGGLTFDCLLNCIDGVERADGVLLVVTTNHLKNVDEALVNRPGRIDRVVEFGDLDREARLRIANRILGNGALATRMVDESGDVPAARFVEVCCAEALKALYEEPKPEEKPSLIGGMLQEKIR